MDQKPNLLPAVQRRALVTGATGFIGSHLVRYLRERGWIVAVVVRPGTTALEEVQSFEYTGQIAELLDAVSKFTPDVTFHLASLFLTTHTPQQVDALISANVLYGAQLLEAMHQGNCKVLINAGTAWQNYAEESPFNSHEFRPVNLYAATKQAFEDLASYYVEATGLRLITLRLFDSYGPGDKRPKLIKLMLQTLMSGQVLGMSPGEQILDLVHVDDVCSAFLHAADLALSETHGVRRVFAVSGGQRMTVRQLASQLEQVAGRKLPLEFGQRPYRPREVMHPWEGPAMPGWKPEVTLEDGLRDLLHSLNL